MMGSSSGYYKVGGVSSSSSNLSPLAPPFMINKSISPNPSMNFPELPAYATCFDGAGPFSNVCPKFGAAEPMVTTTRPPSGGVYRYLDSQTSDSDSYYAGHNNNPFSYGKFPNNIANGDGDVKSYDGFGYDLLTSSCGEEYNAKWGGFWSEGVGKGEHEKWTECATSSTSKDVIVNLCNLSGSKSPFLADGSNPSHPFGDPINHSHPFGDASSKSRVLDEVGNLKQGASATMGSNSHGVDPTISGKSFDIYGGRYHLGSFGTHNQGQNLSFKNIATSSSDYSRMSCFVSGAPSLDTLGLQKPIPESLTPFSSSQMVNGSSSENRHFGQTSYNMFGGNTCSAGSTISMTNKKVSIRRPLVSSKFGSSIQREVVDGFALESNDSEADLQNPAEDSPCWKGASSTRFSPFSSVSEAVVTNVFLNQEDGCKSPRREEPQKKNPSVIASEKVTESTFPQKPTVPSIDLNIPEGLEFLDDCDVFTKDSSIMNDRKSVLDSKLSSTTKHILKEDEVSPPSNISEPCVVAKGGHCTPTGVQCSSGVPSETGKKCSLKRNQAANKNLESRFDVNEVLKTMMKLSQMLHTYCLGNPSALTYQHMGTLQQIASILNAAQTSPGMISSTQDSHFCEGFPVPDMLNYDELISAANKQADPYEYIRELSKASDTFQDYNMTQGIKKILNDNLHEGIDQPEVSYKNLWLEAEAALCVMTSKARFNRMKIKMEKNSQHGMKDKEYPSSPKISSNELVRQFQKSGTARQCNDTGEIPFSNSQHPCLSSMNASIPKEPVKELSFPQFSYDPLATLNNDGGKRCSNEDLLSQDTSCIDTHFSETSNHVRDIETPVMVRYQMLNSCVPDSQITLKRNDQCQKQSSGEENDRFSKIREKNNIETSVMAQYQILKCRMENLGSLHDNKESSQGEDYLNNRVIQNRVSSSNSPHENGAEVKLSVGAEQELINTRREVFNIFSSDWEHVSKDELRRMI